MCTISSVMTEGRVDAVIPRSPRHMGSYRRRPVSGPQDDVFLDDEPWVEQDGHDQGDDILDAYFDGTYQFFPHVLTFILHRLHFPRLVSHHRHTYRQCVPISRGHLAEALC